MEKKMGGARLRGPGSVRACGYDLVLSELSFSLEWGLPNLPKSRVNKIATLLYILGMGGPKFTKVAGSIKLQPFCTDFSWKIKIHH